MFITDTCVVQRIALTLSAIQQDDERVRWKEARYRLHHDTASRQVTICLLFLIFTPMLE